MNDKAGYGQIPYFHVLFLELMVETEKKLK